MLIFCISVLLASTPVVSGLITQYSNHSAPYYISGQAKLVDDQYLVFLRDGHSIKDHFNAVGFDLSKNSSKFYRLDALNAYQARLDSYTVHEMIRHDPGVKFVDHDSYMADFDHVEVGEHLTPATSPNASAGRTGRRWEQQEQLIGYYWNQMISAGKKVVPTPIRGLPAFVGTCC